jgi:hypothetical protein
MSRLFKIDKNKYFYIIVIAGLSALTLAAYFILPGGTKGREFQKAFASLNKCAAIEDRDQSFNCYAKSLRGSVGDNGLGVTAVAFKEYVESWEGASLRGGTCHALGHEIGQEAIMEGYTNKEILTYCTEVCQDGCFNGVGHAYIALNGNLKDVDEFCKPGSFEVDRQRTLACYHGFGHGITDVFGLDLARNLKYCDGIRDDEGRYQCGHAVFMVLSTVQPKALVDLRLPEDMQSFCESSDPLYQQSCFPFSGYLTYAQSGDTKEAFKNCAKVPDRFKRECTERIGESVVIMHSDLEEAKKACAVAGDQEKFGMCMTGVATTFVVSLIYSMEDSFKACESIGINYRKSCYSALGITMEMSRSKEDRIKYCTEFGGEFTDSCSGI